MSESSIGKFLLTIHNPESVVDVYYSPNKHSIVELKQLNGNRSKRYDYPLEVYLQRVKNFKGVGTQIMNHLKYFN